MRVSYGIGTGLAALIIGLALAACEREQRRFRSPPPAAESLKSEGVKGQDVLDPLSAWMRLPVPPSAAPAALADASDPGRSAA